MASVPVKATISAWLYQPFASGARAGAAVTVGGVASRLIVTVLVVTPPSLVAEQVKDAPTVSATSVVASQPCSSKITDSGSWTIQLSVTLLTYQPLAPSVPYRTGVTSGGVGSPGTFGPPLAPAGTLSNVATLRRSRAS